MNKPLLKWSPAQPIRIPDNIISSGAREKKQLGFTPSYESQPAQHMKFLMSNEYMRMWFKERSQYEKDVYTREETIKEESKIKRRVCQRMMTYRRPTKNQFIEDMVAKQKKDQDISEEKNFEKLKFKPECQKKKGTKKLKPEDNKGEEAKEGNEAKEADEGEADIIICTNAKNDCEENK